MTTTPPMTTDWREPYRSRDASGGPETAEAVGWAWIEKIATEEKRASDDEASLLIESPPLASDGRAIVLYRGTRPIAVSTIFRDPMNFAVLIRWRASPRPRRRPHP